MSSPDVDTGKSRVVSGRRPAPGTDPIADAIRERRGARGITPLDANLLHVPLVASGFNALLGAIRTKGKLPGDIREAMILRVAVINHAAFEWIHHEPIARKEGITTGQLYLIRSADLPLPPLKNGTLGPVLTAALLFADYSTRDVRVPLDFIAKFKKELKILVETRDPTLSSDEVVSRVEDLYVEAAMVVASYNMVSRFLLSSDVAGMSDVEVPWPVERKEHFISLAGSDPSQKIHAVTLISSPDAPWLVFSNSLLTDWSMWNYTIPFFLDFTSSTTGSGEGTTKITHNVLLHSQRGHGTSSIPSSSTEGERPVTIPLLAQDIAHLLDILSIPTPVRSVIGVSQGGAAALAFAALYGGSDGPAKAKSIIACDTGPRTPAGNKEAWEERIQLVVGPSSTPPTAGANLRYAQEIGMSELANVTVPRWFPSGSFCHEEPGEGKERADWIRKMIQRTDFRGFIEGARALSEYDVINDLALFSSPVNKVLLVAGGLDGGGKVAQGLQKLRGDWIQAGRPPGDVHFIEIPGSGHLPMVDSPQEFCKAVGEFLGAGSF